MALVGVTSFAKHFKTVMNYIRPSVLALALTGSTKLKRLCLMSCYNITGYGLNNAVKRLPHLETLELSYTSIRVEDIEVIRHNCPQLKSFTMKKGLGAFMASQ
ncbi:hypothetical protein OSB04_001826 [Centaurea solstitialis]|uniref:F-box/LRR-repeat protein 15/At3g58940/PEG3-like LRR domain-containing protein n=1 Tax=Centaurea solstitialis TaxID=347529 RepID=A0AA38TRR3_9ASTR|nr:hypothetical protein OSB04_001826 [Centaurea solstitialis]